MIAVLSIFVTLLTGAVIGLGIDARNTRRQLRSLSGNLVRETAQRQEIDEMICARIRHLNFPAPTEGYSRVTLVSEDKVRNVLLEPLYALIKQLGYKWEAPHTAEGRLVKVKK